MNGRAFSADSGNITVEIVGETRREAFNDLAKLNESGLRITKIDTVQQEKHRPFGHSGEQFTDEDRTATAVFWHRPV